MKKRVIVLVVHVVVALVVGFLIGRQFSASNECPEAQATFNSPVFVACLEPDQTNRVS
jgi:flagellar basal body-associated protein FliL